MALWSFRQDIKVEMSDVNGSEELWSGQLHLGIIGIDVILQAMIFHEVERENSSVLRTESRGTSMEKGRSPNRDTEHAVRGRIRTK